MEVGPLRMLGTDAGLLENVAKAHSRERGLPHRAVFPLEARHARRLEAAPVARALEDRDHRDFGEGLLQVRRGERAWRRDQTFDAELSVALERWRAEVTADEERRRRRD